MAWCMCNPIDNPGWKLTLQIRYFLQAQVDKQACSGGCMQANTEAAGDNRSGFHGGLCLAKQLLRQWPKLDTTVIHIQGGKSTAQDGHASHLQSCQHCIRLRLSAHTFAATIVSADADDVTNCWKCCYHSVLCAARRTPLHSHF